MARGEWATAAVRFGAIGWTYDRALMLSMLDDEDSLVEALDIARGVGAEPLVKHVARRLSDLGIRVPLGQRDATRSNPAGLTARQLEVLTLPAAGLTNTEIAERLVVSQRTAEHHVAAVLTKLGVTSRRAAARRAVELGLEPAPDRCSSRRVDLDRHWDSVGDDVVHRGTRAGLFDELAQHLGRGVALDLEAHVD